jgi:hypothetical protein
MVVGHFLLQPPERLPDLVLFLQHHALRIDVGFAESSINKAFELVLDRGLDLGRIGGVDVART